MQYGGRTSSSSSGNCCFGSAVNAVAAAVVITLVVTLVVGMAQVLKNDAKDFRQEQRWPCYIVGIVAVVLGLRDAERKWTRALSDKPTSQLRNKKRRAEEWRKAGV